MIIIYQQYNSYKILIKTFSIKLQTQKSRKDLPPLPFKTNTIEFILFVYTLSFTNFGMPILQKNDLFIFIMQNIICKYHELKAKLYALARKLMSINKRNFDRWCYNIQLMKKLVTVDFKKEQGLILTWNYIDLSKHNKFFRHIIVLLTADQQIAQDALESYIANIKMGDLYTAVYYSRGAMRLREWRQKTNRSQNGYKSYLNQQLGVSFSFEEACPLIQKQIQQFSEPTIVNFVLQQQSEIANLKLKIQQRKIQQKIKFICTIFSHAPDNHISISSGINQLCLDDKFIFQFYHHYINQMAMEYAHLTITCKNGQINSNSQIEWRNTAFNKIQRKYYGPSIRYVKDVLHFLNTKGIFEGEYDLDISLNFKCFGGATYTAEKRVTISFDICDMYNRTMCPPRKNRIYCSTEDILLQQNPYQTETLIFFDKISANYQTAELP